MITKLENNLNPLESLGKSFALVITSDSLITADQSLTQLSVRIQKKMFLDRGNQSLRNYLPPLTGHFHQTHCK